MRIVEIESLENGAHANQTYPGTVPEGWALIPDTVDTVNFPFGTPSISTINGVPVVSSWAPGIVPDVQDPEPTPTEFDILRADVDYLLMEQEVRNNEI